MCQVVSALQIGSAVLAFGAAIFWFAAAWAARGSFLNTGLDTLDANQRRQSRYNALGAVCAGFAALAQIALTQFPTCINLG